MHEASLYDENSFITLTYADEHLPSDKSVNKPDWQLFLKRLRKRINQEEPGRKIRFMMCAEYGTDQDPNSPNVLGRPHYHACLFNWNFPDKQYYRTTDAGHHTFMSPLLDEAWGKGRHEVGELTRESAEYVARYVTKKQNGDLADDHYSWVEPTTGEITFVHPEFSLQSRRPGIGKHWYDRYKTDLVKGFITDNGKKMPIPKYYRNLAKLEDGSLSGLHIRASQQIDPMDPERCTTRLRTKEEIRERKTKTLKRKL